MFKKIAEALLRNIVRARIALEPRLKNKLELFESSLDAHYILNRL
ncbi:MAG: hypothetical protein NTV63_02085 [Candidatus Woesearchaeota archaeon]|nr:hypothetical protein [Candidatus Woesearchaeota archaeon]